jgi:hypothetical protein
VGTVAGDGKWGYEDGAVPAGGTTNATNTVEFKGPYAAGGLYKLNPFVAHSFKAPGFKP